MYAVIRTGGKQYKVQAGDVVQVEKLDQKLGAEFTINEVLMVGGESTQIGTPLVSGAAVTAVVTKQARGRKVLIFKKKRRQGYRRLKAHKQEFTELFIKAISFGGKTAKAETEANIIDVAAKRIERILTKQAARKERVESMIGQGRAAKAETKQATAKVAKKKVAKKVAKKTSGKKAVGKKVAKKAAKKTSKKA